MLFEKLRFIMSKNKLFVFRKRQIIISIEIINNLIKKKMIDEKKCEWIIQKVNYDNSLKICLIQRKINRSNHVEVRKYLYHF